MEERTRLFVFASPDVQELLTGYRIDLVELLAEEGVEVGQAFAENPATSLDPGLKEPATVILASAALVLALTPIISRALDRLTRKSVVVKEMILVPVEDSQGNVVQDSLGKPILQWI